MGEQIEDFSLDADFECGEIDCIELKNRLSAYPVDTSIAINSLIENFEKKQLTQTVSFRKLVPWIKMGERATHYLHSYPAKLLPQIAHFFLASITLCSQDDIVLDPFGGTGTVALEAAMSGRVAYYADANPLARLISSAKTNCINIEEAKLAHERVLKKFKLSRKSIPPDVVNITHWYTESSIRQLSRLKAAIDSEPESPIKDFFWTTFSSTVRKSSLADPKLSVPVRLKLYGNGSQPLDDQKIWTLYDQQLLSNCDRQVNFQKMLGTMPNIMCVGNDARHLCTPDLWNANFSGMLNNEAIGLVITSPPYAGAQKYIRASSLSLGWLDLASSAELKHLENANIGREHFPKALYRDIRLTGLSSADRVIKMVFEKNQLRAAIISTYLLEMKAAILEICRVLKPGGHVVLVIGNNEVCGEAFESSEYLTQYFLEQGLKLRLKLLDDIKSRGLMTKRNRAASIITREWVLLFQKPEST